uniref:Bm3300, isoform e n=1 Tax=Brugia malayi TaxID=6279 RepID=A0A1I9GEW6_BRUMA|nr:Bm3300, isoform e [Brugia malayi]
MDYFPGAVSAFLVREGMTLKSGNERKELNQGMMSQWFCSRNLSLNLTVLNCPLVKRSCSRSQQDSMELIVSYQKVEMKIQKGETIAKEETRTIFVGNERNQKLFPQFGTVESVRLRCFAASNKKITKKRDIPSGVRSLTFHVKFKGAKSIEAGLAFLKMFLS